VFWLAAQDGYLSLHTETPVAVHHEGLAQPAPIVDKPIEDNDALPGDKPEPTDEDGGTRREDVQVYASGDVGEMDRKVRASPVVVPAGRALQGRLSLARSLKPFQQRRPSRQGRELDELQTVEITAELGGELFPVFRPLNERWFDVDVVLEDDPAIALWRDTMRDFCQMLGDTGAFRDVHFWRLRMPAQTQAEGNEEQTAYLETPSGTSTSIRTLIAPGVHRLIIFVTHGNSPRWTDGSYACLLNRWRHASSLVLLHLLDRNHWKRCALGEPHGLCYAEEPGLTTANLRTEAFWWKLDDDEVGTRISVPVVALSPGSLSQWAHMQMSRGRRSHVFMLTTRRTIPENAMEPPPQIDAELGIDLLREASPSAFRLAVYLCSSAFTIPVARLVQEAQFGAAARQSDLAEVLLSGLVRARSAPGADPNELYFEFLSEARAILIRSLRDADAESIAATLERRLSDYLQQIQGRSITFRSLVPDENGKYELPDWAQPFARVGLSLLGASVHSETSVTLFLQGWGRVVDPDRDCRFEVVSNRLIISVPPTLHNLSTEFSELNAPRVLQEVNGDFVAHIRVVGHINHDGKPTSSHYLAYQGTGLLLWEDENTYIRLERSAYVTHGDLVHSVHFEVRSRRQVTVDLHQAGIEKPIFLRLARSGSQIRAAGSTDAVTWTEFDPVECLLTEDVKIGIIAVNTASAPLRAELEGFRVVKEELPTIRFRHFSMFREVRNDRKWHWWCIFVDGPATLLRELASVEYRLHESFPVPTRKTSDQSNRFAIYSSGWGGFRVQISVTLRNRRVVHTSHWLTLVDDNWPKPPIERFPNPEVDQVYNHLFHKRYRWRTKSLLSRRTGLSDTRLTQILAMLENANMVRRNPFPTIEYVEMWGATAVVGIAPKQAEDFDSPETWVKDAAHVDSMQESVRPAADPSLPSSQLQVLWVDDSPGNNEKVRAELQKEGIMFTLSLSTEDGLDKARQTKYDLVISDLRRDWRPFAGFDLLDTMRKAGDRTPFILYAGDWGMRNQEEARQKGASHVTNRPSELMRLVNQLAEKKRLQTLADDAARGTSIPSPEPVGPVGRPWPTCVLVGKFVGHANHVDCVAWSPDSALLASGSYDNDIRIWDARTRKCLRILGGHNRGVSGLAWSPDGTMLASGSYDNTIRLWDVAEGRCVASPEAHKPHVRGVAWSFNARFLASCGEDSEVVIWDTQPIRVFRKITGMSDWTNAIAWSPDGRLLAIASGDGIVTVRSILDPEAQTRLQGHKNYVNAVAWSHEGRLLASGDGDGVIYLWDEVAKQPVHRLTEHSDKILRLCFSFDDQFFASQGQDRTLVWACNTWKVIHAVNGPFPSQTYLPLDFATNQLQLAGPDNDGTVISLWKLTGSSTPELGEAQAR
jgi:WD40 repeat protein/CheY-like chemotaxis protein